jgi:hypothetical protein
MPRKPLTTLPPQSEASFLEQIIDLAHLFGWRVAHFRAARTFSGWRTPVQGDGKGFPDLVLCRRRRPNRERTRTIFADIVQVDQVFD